MTRAGLIKRLSRKRGITRAQAELFIETIFDCVAQSLCRGERVDLRGFGSFDMRQYRSHLGRNPRTGESVEVRPRRLARFRASPLLANQLNQRREPPARLVHRGPGTPRKAMGITGVWMAFEPDGTPKTDEITRRMG